MKANEDCYYHDGRQETFTTRPGTAGRQKSQLVANIRFSGCAMHLNAIKNVEVQ